MGSAPASLADNPFLITLLLEMQTTIFLRTEMSRKTEYVHNPCFLSANILKILGVFAENQTKNKFYDVSSKSNLMKIVLNNIYTLDKYFFIDISMINKTKIRYDIDQIRFKIEDKKQTKATNFQSIEILPLMQVNKNLVFKKNYRNIFVFEKFTFPDEKVLTIEISEKQISGRTITLRIDYADILHADAFTE